MSRLADEDFLRLVEFARSYSLKEKFDDELFVGALRRIHRRHLALLTLWAQIDSVVVSGGVLAFGTGIPVTPAVIDHVKGAVSDASESFFCAMHGSYKAAHALLRSCVENYIRAFGSIADPAVAELTSVYQLFDAASSQPFFASAPGDSCFIEVKAGYGSLCAYVHSGVPAHPVPVHALDYFPKYDSGALQQWFSLYDKVIKAMLISIVETEPSLFIDMHYRSQDALAEMLPKETLRSIHGGH